MGQSHAVQGLIHTIMGHGAHFQSQCVPYPYSVEAEDKGDSGKEVDAC